jgi:hypothetical protein
MESADARKPDDLAELGCFDFAPGRGVSCE